MREKVRICTSTLLATKCANARNKYATRDYNIAPLMGLGLCPNISTCLWIQITQCRLVSHHAENI